MGRTNALKNRKKRTFGKRIDPQKKGQRDGNPTPRLEGTQGKNPEKKAGPEPGGRENEKGLFFPPEGGVFQGGWPG